MTAERPPATRARSTLRTSLFWCAEAELLTGHLWDSDLSKGVRPAGAAPVQFPVKHLGHGQSTGKPSIPGETPEPHLAVPGKPAPHTNDLGVTPLNGPNPTIPADTWQ